MSGDQIQYEELAQEALRGVIRTIMGEIEKTGELPGEHHFFIAFDTQAEGVDISSRLKAQYEEDMTIVLQHQFWDLIAEQDYFEVKLSFNNVLERLVIPYKSIKVFFDPSVPYGLQFGPSDGEEVNLTPDGITDRKSDDNQTGQLPAETLLEKNGSTDEAENLANPDETADDGKSADIVSLDTFRKK
ncbi:MAG: SspB family protein [Methyloligellaceae bacterium]